jgi:hypothetical protein
VGVGHVFDLRFCTSSVFFFSSVVRLFSRSAAPPARCRPLPLWPCERARRETRARAGPSEDVLIATHKYQGRLCSLRRLLFSDPRAARATSFPPRPQPPSLFLFLISPTLFFSKNFYRTPNCARSLGNEVQAHARVISESSICLVFGVFGGERAIGGGGASGGRAKKKKLSLSLSLSPPHTHKPNAPNLNAPLHTHAHTQATSHQRALARVGSLTTKQQLGFFFARAAHAPTSSPPPPTRKRWPPRRPPPPPPTRAR